MKKSRLDFALMFSLSHFAIYSKVPIRVLKLTFKRCFWCCITVLYTKLRVKIHICTYKTEVVTQTQVIFIPSLTKEHLNYHI